MRPPPLPPPPPPARSWVSIEQFMGVKLFAWLGGFALFLGVALFVKYSFDRGLIAPEVQVAAGFLIGLALLAGGLLVPRPRFAVTAQTLCATGVVSLYAVTYAARAIYAFPWFGHATTFALMTGVTAAAFLLAVRLDARGVAILGIVGGFLTPVLFPTEEKSAVALFGYATLLDLGLMAVTGRKQWTSLVLFGAVGTASLEWAWVLAAFEPGDPLPTLVPFAWFNLLFTACLVAGVRRGLPPRSLATASAGLCFATLAFCAWLITVPDVSRQPWLLFGLVFLADLALLAMVAADARLIRFHQWAGLAVFCIAGLWSARYGGGERMPWALGVNVIFALVHALAPAWLDRVMPGALARSKWATAFPALALALALVPLFGGGADSWALWPAVIAIDAVAFTVAVVTASVGVIVGAMVLTLAVAATSIFHAPIELAAAPVAVSAGFGLFFWVAGFACKGRLAPAGENAVALAPAGGVLMPFVLLLGMALRHEIDDPTGLFGVALLLGSLAFAGARFFKADWMIPATLAGTALVEYGWHLRQFDPATPGIALGWYLVLFGVYFAYPFFFRKEIGASVAAVAAAAAAGPAHFFQVLDAVKRAWPGFPMPGLVAAGFALPTALALRWAIRRAGGGTNGKPDRLAAMFGAATLFFLIAAVPVQLGKEWVTIGWAAEGLSLVWLWRRIPHPGLRGVGVALLVAAFARLALNAEIRGYHPRGEWPVLNWYLYTFGSVAAALFVAGKWVRMPEGKRGLSRALFVMGWLLAFMLLNIEIADFFGKPGAGLSLAFRGNFARDMACSVGWATFAVAMLVAGIRFRSIGGRYAALALLGVAALKVFLLDLARLDALYRIGALVGLAIAAIGASFLYQRFVRVDDPKSRS
jgi:uncharacterized membrane protein